MKRRTRIVMLESKNEAPQRGMYLNKPSEGGGVENERCICRRIPVATYPRPVDVELVRLTKASVELPDDLCPRVLSPALYDVLAPHATTQVFGSVYLVKANGERVLTQHRTAYDHPGNEIHVFGAAGSRYLGCEVCSRVVSWPKGSKQWVSARQADGLAWAFGELAIFVSEEIFRMIPIDRFPDLRAIPIGVVERPNGI